MTPRIIKPGYAHGYAPQGEVQEFIRDVEIVADPMNVLAAMRTRGSGAAWIEENRILKKRSYLL